MTTYCPEFSAFWLAMPEPGGDRQGVESCPSDQGLSPALQLALEELVERVNAARCVV
jgi:hypothetical protein